MQMIVHCTNKIYLCMGFSCNICAFDFVYLLVLSLLVYNKQEIRGNILDK
jgi:hypothetical protein